MTTPTPNERDREVAAKSYSEYFGNDFSLPTPIGTAVATYRAEIEAALLDSKGNAILLRLAELQTKNATLLAALDKAEKALTECESIEAFKLKVESLTAIRQAKELSN